MSVTAWLCLLALGSAVPLGAQTACSADSLGDAARTAIAIRHQLHDAAIAPNDPHIPPAVATQLQQFKAALAQATQAAFACASAAATPDDIQKSLADALQANVAPSTETPDTAANTQDLGVFGSDLSVQVFQLFGTPRIFEVDLRYGIQCGDDNLLMVFDAAKEHAPDGWHERLRWDAPAYSNVGDAFGDFILLTPLTGSYKKPTWRFLVAHGHPACEESPRRSHFDLDLLSPTADPAKPAVDWRFSHTYTQGNAVPRLATTEDTIDFRIAPGSITPGSIAPGSDAPASDTPGRPAARPEVYRFRIAANGRIEPSPAEGGADNPAGSAPPATSRSPR